MIRTICGVKLVDRVSSDILKERLGVVVKKEDILAHSCLCHTISRDTDLQILEVVEVEIEGLREKGCLRKSWEECMKHGLVRFALKQEDAEDRE